MDWDYERDYLGLDEDERDYPGGLTPKPASQPAGISIGVPAYAYGHFHFHYNQVDNRKVTVSNNAPEHVTTTTTNLSHVDHSAHHNNNAPQKNRYDVHAENVGNSRTEVNQTATSFRKSEPSSSSRSSRHYGPPPSESLPIRDRQYKQSKKVTYGEWSGRKTMYETVPNDRPC